MKEKIKNLSERIEKTLSVIQTEEATKNAYIMPFLQLLGYDVFNPLEVVPEFTADIGIKKGEKVDYAIMLGDAPAILIECKDCRNDLNIDNESQLFRYFHSARAKFGVLTNGISWKFFTDLVEPNKMDAHPFLEINLLEPDRINHAELEKFSKAKFDAENIRAAADHLKCTSSIKRVLTEEFADPSEDFLRLIFRRMNTTACVFNEKQKAKIKPIVKSAIDLLISEKIETNLESMRKAAAAAREAATAAQAPISEVVTSEAEMEGFNIVRAIGSELVSPEKIVMRDAKSYCAVLFEDNNRRPLARLYFNNPDKLAIGLFATPEEEKVPLAAISEIYALRAKIHAAIERYTQSAKE